LKKVARFSAPPFLLGHGAKRYGMSDVNVLPADAFQAIAVAQATYGLPDLLIARIAQCSTTQIARNRKRVGWSKRKVSLAYLRGQELEDVTAKADGGSPKRSEVPDILQALSGLEKSEEIDVAALKAVIDRMLLRLANMLAGDDHDLLDPMLPKQIEAIGAAAKHVEKLVDMQAKLNARAVDEQEAAQRDPVETARVLRKIEKRVHDLAEQRARDIISGAVDAGGGGHGRSGVDDPRATEPAATEQT
jgi:signal transduction histidine kinase